MAAVDLKKRAGCSCFFAALTFAQRAFAAAEILALPAALILRFGLRWAFATGTIN
jgi:hypothetical protein